MTLPCEDVQRAIPWLLDDELDPETSLDIETHLKTCVACRAQLEREGQLRLVLRRAAASIAVPVSLRNRIYEAMERERKGSGLAKFWPALVAAAILLSFIWKGAGGGFGGDLEELALRHGRDLPMDVVASDIAQVQTYLSRKLPFAVRLPKIAEDANQSLGGRIIQLGDHEAAYVRYDTPHGRVSMMVYPETADGKSSEVEPLYSVGNRQVVVKRVRGYTAAQWKAQGLVYSVVSDLPEEELTLVLHELP